MLSIQPKSPSTECINSIVNLCAHIIRVFHYLLHLFKIIERKIERSIYCMLIMQCNIDICC
jgi:uncharacterized protein with PQ loop repeat